MIYTSLTDNELRLAIDNAPQDIAIRDEVVRRFLLGSEENARLVDDVGSLTVQLADADRKIEEQRKEIYELENA